MSVPSNSDQPGSPGIKQQMQLDHSLRLQIWETPLLRHGSSVLEAFAWEEVMCRRVGEGQLPVAHIWRHPDAFVAGLRDRRLPQAVEAMERIRSQGTAVCVRPSGGAAVPLNPGVVNVSLILPNPGRAINIHDDFREMASLIAESLTPWSSQARTGEIEGAFCPGDYDVSVGGLKFCGIAQRRQAKAYIITAFIIVEGQEGTNWQQTCVSSIRMQQTVPAKAIRMFGPERWRVCRNWQVSLLLRRIQLRWYVHCVSVFPWRRRAVC
ncbi:Biotin/lipoate A/B protein ligase family protein [Paenibacillus sp. 276b]|nr:hypothetical protein [Paenibacillus sp. 276b]SEB26245.1 Biotin/lipoate A/B protein ligase family protein [Paenibacillus sp. 276b]